MLNVCVVLLDEGYTSTALVPIEVFHSAGVLWRQLIGEQPEPRFKVTIVSVDGRPVRSSYDGLTMAPRSSIWDVRQADIVIVPSSALALDEKAIENSPLLPWLRQQYESGAYIAGLCVGAAYLAEAGLLDGKRATTHWAVGKHLARRYPKVDWRPDLVITEDSRLICSGGVTAAADVSLYLVEKLCGHEIAMQTAKALLMSMPRTHQSGYAMLPLSPPHPDERIRAVESCLQAKFRDPHPTEELAKIATMSVRTFLRRFKAATGREPAAYLRTVRIEAAKTILERESISVQAVANAVGYEDVSFFRTLFKRATGMTPAEYRSRFACLAVREGDLEDLSDARLACHLSPATSRRPAA